MTRFRLKKFEVTNIENLKLVELSGIPQPFSWATKKIANALLHGERVEFPELIAEVVHKTAAAMFAKHSPKTLFS